ncbi:MAG TPA: ribbon-helix-helix protein, CopG family [Methanothrix sp.]|nr:ribbon-helix-helix protein, CopG family [Methanothrix sp.]
MPERITIALDEGSADLIKKLKDEMGLSQSELMRDALKFFGKHKMLFESFDDKMIYTYTEMLGSVSILM